MNKHVTIIPIVFLSATFFWGCAPEATDDEINKMCANLEKVRGEITVPSKDEELAKINEDYKKKEVALLDWKARDMKSWDDELAAKLKALEDEAAAEKDVKKAKKPKTDEPVEEKPTAEDLKKLYDGKKAIGAKQFDDDIAKIPDLKKAAIDDLMEKIKGKEALLNENIKLCADEAKKEGVSSKLAQCRIGAPDKDTYWNKCK
ncbi:MAG: hypothetical protein JXR91_15910 [Deltaproteobacteria bacterium]|nr:hypothetical protein [Deltaproteobacteria bacterium]